MQLSVPEISDLSTELAHVLKEYGADDTANPDKAAFAKNCILARRLIERGVRFVQLFNATRLHLLGLDHERLTFEHNGEQRRLTNVEGHVIPEVLA